MFTYVRSLCDIIYFRIKLFISHEYTLFKISSIKPVIFHWLFPFLDRTFLMDVLRKRASSPLEGVANCQALLIQVALRRLSRDSWIKECRVSSKVPEPCSNSSRLGTHLFTFMVNLDCMYYFCHDLQMCIYYVPYNGKFGVSGVALTLPPPENFNLAVFNLAINGHNSKLKLPPKFPVIW